MASLHSFSTLLKPSYKQLIISTRQTFHVRAQSFKDHEGSRSSDMVEANLTVLRERIMEVKMKERLERCCRCENGWNYASGYDYKLKKQVDRSQFLDLVCLVCGNIGITCLSGTFFLLIISFIVHLNQL